MISSKGISTAQRLNCSLYIFFMLGILLRNSSTLMTVLEPFSLSCSCLTLPQSLAPFVCLFSYWQSSFCKDHWFNFWFKIFFLCKFHGPFFWFWNSNIFLSGGTFRKSSSILFKTRFDVFPPDNCWRSCFCVFNKKSKFFLEIAILSGVVGLLESILAFSLKQYLVYFHQTLVEDWLFFVFLIKKEFFVAEEN